MINDVLPRLNIRINTEAISTIFTLFLSNSAYICVSLTFCFVLSEHSLSFSPFLLISACIFSQYLSLSLIYSDLGIICFCFETHMEWKSHILYHTHTRTLAHLHTCTPFRTSPVFQRVTSDGWMAEDEAHICAVSQSQLDVDCLCTKTLTQLVLAG